MAEDNMEAESSKGKKKSDYAEVEFEIGDMEFEAKGRSVVVERMFRLLLEKIEAGKLVKTFKLLSHEEVQEEEEEEEEEEPEVVETKSEEPEEVEPPVVKTYETPTHVEEPPSEEPSIPTEAYLDPPPAWDSLDSESPPESEPEKEEKSPY
ncbi:MAG: hypothetical protein ACTSUB_00595 [Candidatus Thorarchaeota archaeon]